MDDLIDLIATDQSAAQVTDKIKDVLYGKAAQRIDALKPDLAAKMFDPTEDETEDEISDEPVDELEDSTEEEEES